MIDYEKLYKELIAQVANFAIDAADRNAHLSDWDDACHAQGEDYAYNKIFEFIVNQLTDALPSNKAES